MKRAERVQAIIVILLVVAIMFSILSIVVAYSLSNFNPIFQFKQAESEADFNDNGNLNLVVEPEGEK